MSVEESSWGYDFIIFCKMIGWPLDLWQRWLAIHLGELLLDGTPRFLKAIVLVARQNGKTVFTRLLILYWMFVERVPEILGTSTDRAAAFRSWKKTIKMAEDNPILADALPGKHTTGTTGLETFFNIYESVYRFSAPNDNAGRGDSLPRAVLDELRQHKNRDVWDAVVPAMAALQDALVVCISNEGGMDSVVLHEEYDDAFENLDSDETDTFLAAWSSPPNSDPTDLEALAWANPSLNRVRPDGTGLTTRSLLGEARKAKRIGGETLIRFQTERMCQRVDLLNPAIDPVKWLECGTDSPIDLALHKDKLALSFDVSADETHGGLVAAVTIDGITNIEVVEKWEGPGWSKRMDDELPDWILKLGGQEVVWDSKGPAAKKAALMSKRRNWPPRRMNFEEVAADRPAVCMGFADQVSNLMIRHPKDPALNEHVKQTTRLHQGTQGVWVFERRNGEGQADRPIDLTYAAAQAVHASRTIKPRLKLIGA